MSTMFSLLPWWVKLPFLAAGGFLILIVVFAAYSALCIIAERAWRGGFRLADSITEFFVEVTIAAFAGCVAPLKMLGNLLWWLVTILWEHTGVRAYDALAHKAEALRQRQQLWHHWRREFRDQFATFEEFLDAFEGRSPGREEPRFEDEPRKDGREQARRDQDQPRPPPDPQHAAYVTACRLFGLPESGFTVEQFNARYRALIRTMHPDRGGSNERAAALNAARDFITRRKGWT